MANSRQYTNFAVQSNTFPSKMYSFISIVVMSAIVAAHAGVLPIGPALPAPALLASAPYATSYSGHTVTHSLSPLAVAPPLAAPLAAPLPAPLPAPLAAPLAAPFAAPLAAPFAGPFAAAPLSAPLAAPYAAPYPFPAPAPLAAPLAAAPFAANLPLPAAYSAYPGLLPYSGLPAASPLLLK